MLRGVIKVLVFPRLALRRLGRFRCAIIHNRVLFLRFVAHSCDFIPCSPKSNFIISSGMLFCPVLRSSEAAKNISSTTTTTTSSSTYTYKFLIWFMWQFVLYVFFFCFCFCFLCVCLRTGVKRRPRSEAAFDARISLMSATAPPAKKKL